MKNNEDIVKIIDLLETKALSPDIWHRSVKKYPKSNDSLFTKHEIAAYIKENNLKVSDKVADILKMKPRRTLSGIAPITIFTKPYACSGNCIYCPSIEGMPKSYLPNEPAMQRAIIQKFDPHNQIIKRLESFNFNGHDTSKIEIIVSGGTWDDYPYDYRLWYMCEVFRALNGDTNPDYIPSYEKLRELQKINSQTDHRCVGMSIETRPDRVNFDSVAQMREMGVTKVQIGVQSLDDEILKLNCRGHNIQKTFEAINLLRNNGFKIQIHIMCNLYGSDLARDYEDFKKVFNDQNVLPDEIKIYPCSIVENTPLHYLFQKGKYIPYTTKELIELLAKCKEEIKPFCRVSRLFRDIPSDSIVEGNKNTNLREMVQKYMSEHNMKCQCIRCNEIKEIAISDDLRLEDYEYETAISNEHFLTYRNNNNQIAGFLRLSLYKSETKIPRLINVDSMIREVHVYGKVVNVGDKTKGASQHTGLGTKLLHEAESLAVANGKKRLGVISAIGTREYYEKRGFEIESQFGYGIKNI